MKLTWFGHSNFLLEADGVRVLIDPFFEGNPKAPGGWQDAGKVDAVLVTHDHGDHLGQAVVICKASGAKLVCIFDLAAKMQELGVPAGQILGMNLGGTVEAAGVRVKMVQAVHSSPTGVPAGYIMTFPGGYCAYHSGDTALFSDMKLFRRFSISTWPSCPSAVGSPWTQTRRPWPARSWPAEMLRPCTGAPSPSWRRTPMPSPRL